MIKFVLMCYPHEILRQVYAQTIDKVRQPGHLLLLSQVLHALPPGEQLVQHGQSPLVFIWYLHSLLCSAASLSLVMPVAQGQRPEASATTLRFEPVMVLRSLETRLDNMATSLLELFLRFLKKVAYLTRISVLAESRPGERTCCSRYVLVSLGQSQASLMAVFQDLKT